MTEVRGDDGDGKDGRQDFAVNEDREPGLVATSAGKDVFGDEAGVQSDAHRDVSSLATGENIGAALAAGEKDEGAGDPLGNDCWGPSRGGGEEETLSGVECRTVHGKEAAAALTDVSETVPPTLSDVSRPPGDGTTNTIPSVSGVNSAGADAAAQTQPEDDPGESRNRRADGGLGGLRKHSALVDGRGLVPGEHVIGGDDERLVAALEEATGWRMKSRAAEAALADMRETLGDVLELSFRCGEEHGCHNRASEKIATTSADATVDSVDGDQQGVEAASAAFAGKGPESRDKNFAGGAVTSRLTTPDPVANDEEGGNDDMEKKGGERVPDEECAGKAGMWRCSAGGRLSGRCGACEARAKAVHELLSR